MLFRYCVLATLLIGFTLFAVRGTHSVAFADPMPSHGLGQVPAQGDFWRDDFNGPTLSPAWSWINEDPNSWSLTDRPGYLRIHTQPGTLDGANNTVSNVLLRAAPPVPYVLSTRFELSPTHDFHEAGLLVYQDADNYVRLSQIHHSGLPGDGDDFYLFTREINGVRSGTYQPSAQQAVELRLIVEAHAVTAEYKDNNGGWALLGRSNVTDPDSYPFVAIAAHNGVATPPAPSIPADFDFVEVSIPLPSGNCRFFTAAGSYHVCDDTQARFLSAFNQYGLQRVGYPISRRYLRDGFVTQAFQKAILQWRPDGNYVAFVNIFDELHSMGFDQRLFETRQTPFPLENFDPPGTTFQAIVTRRQQLLSARPAIQQAYLSVSDPLLLFGLPTSGVSDMGNHYAIRLQRTVLQEWKEAVPWAAVGQVTVANGGDIAKELGALPTTALIPEVQATTSSPAALELPGSRP